MQIGSSVDCTIGWNTYVNADKTVTMTSTFTLILFHLLYNLQPSSFYTKSGDDKLVMINIDTTTSALLAKC